MKKLIALFASLLFITVASTQTVDTIQISFGNTSVTLPDDWSSAAHTGTSDFGKYDVTLTGSYYSTASGYVSGIYPTLVEQSYSYYTLDGGVNTITLNGFSEDLVSGYLYMSRVNVDGERLQILSINGSVIDTVDITEAAPYAISNIDASSGSIVFSLQEYNSANTSYINAMQLFTSNDATADECDTLGMPTISITSTSPSAVSMSFSDYPECFNFLKIYRDDSLIYNTSVAISDYFDDSLSRGTDYVYKVESINKNGDISSETTNITTNTSNNITLRNGESVYLNGVNIAIQNWTYNDFHSLYYDSLRWDSVYQHIADAGGNAARHFLFFNTSNMLQTDDSLFRKIPDQEIANIVHLYDIAEEKGIYMCGVFSSYIMAYIEGDVNRNKRVKTQEGIDNYIDSIMIPILTELYDHPAVAMWEVMNEPEWLVTTTAAEISKHDILNFLGQCAAAIHDFDAQSLVTVGGSTAKFSYDGSFSDDTLFAITGDPLAVIDIYQPHYYEWMKDGINLDPFSDPLRIENFDKPTIIGEVPGYGDTITGAKRSLEYMYTEGLDRGYSGIWSWAYFESNVTPPWAWPAGQNEMAVIADILGTTPLPASGFTDSLKLSFGNGTDVDDWVGILRTEDVSAGKYDIYSLGSWYSTTSGSLTGVQPTAVDQSYLFSSGAGQPSAWATIWGIETDSVHAYAHIGTTNSSHTDTVFLNVNNTTVDTIIPYNHTELLDLGTFYSGGDFNISVTDPTDEAMKPLNSLALYEIGEPVRSANPTFIDTLRILFTGNSITYYNDGIDSIFRGIANYHPTTKVITTSSTILGSTLSGRWGTHVQDSVENGGHDIVVIQEHPETPYTYINTFKEWALKWDSLAVSNGASTIHFMQHPTYADFDLHMNTIDSITTLVGELTGAPVAPCGLALEEAYDGTNYDDLYQDYIHQTYDGSYLYACVLYATIFNESPVGLPALKCSDAVGYQTIAWDIYQSYTGSTPIDPCDTTTILTSAIIVNSTGFDGEINLTVSGGLEPYTYLWSNTPTTQDIINLRAGTYSVTVTDDNGCTGSDSYEVTDLCEDAIIITLTASPDTNNQSVGQVLSSVTGGLPPYTYDWVSGGGTEPHIYNKSMDWYTVVVSDDNGCSTAEGILVDNIIITPETPIKIGGKMRVSSRGKIIVSKTGKIKMQ